MCKSVLYNQGFLFLLLVLSSKEDVQLVKRRIRKNHSASSTSCFKA
jgi:hypothetical protein